MSLVREFWEENLPLEVPPMDWHVRTYVSISSPVMEAPTVTSMAGGTIFAAYLIDKGFPFRVEDTSGRVLLTAEPDEGLKGLRWFYEGVEVALQSLRELVEVRSNAVIAQRLAEYGISDVPSSAQMPAAATPRVEGDSPKNDNDLAVPLEFDTQNDGEPQ